MLLNSHHLQVPTESERKDRVKQRAAQLSLWDPETPVRRVEAQQERALLWKQAAALSSALAGPLATGNLDMYTEY